MLTPKLTDAQIDRALSAVIPGGSAARDWFLPHEQERGLVNVRDVVRAMVAALPLEGFALVPIRMTREMSDVTDEEGWQWEDVLAAAGAITPKQYDDAARTPVTLAEADADMDADSYEIDGQSN